jgi:polyhydroxyalkanoate synthesis regulator phasin
MKFALAITGALARTDLLEDVTTLLSTSATEDDAVMLSVAAIRDSIQLQAEENQASTNNALSEMARSQDPRKASDLLQEFALNTVEAGEGIDADTRQKLIAIRDILTNETYISLEQAHRHDQDLLNKHARAINECGQKHIRHLQQDIEGQEVQLVRDTEDAMYKCRGLPEHAIAVLQKPERYWSNWTGVNNPKYDDPNFMNCNKANDDMFAKCDALDNFIRGLPRPNCQPPIGTTEMAVPTCDGGQPVGVDSDLFDWFTNMKENALFYQGEWKKLKEACDAARAYYKEICLDECARKQRQFETAFCSYRQGLHATCREYQGCHVLNEQQFNDLVKSVMYNADSRKIDWKAIHKIECYINVLISTETNEIRAKDLLNCEAGNLNTIETILTGFNETNYLSLIVPEINVSCWDLDVPQFIDFKECDMSSVKQHPCTEDWMARYNGLIAPADCTECAPIPDEFQYHMEQESAGATSDEFGGGWYYVHEIGRSATDINDLTELAPGGYHLPSYVTSKLRWNEVLVERVSQNWCDSWGSQSSYWVEEGGASMCVQSDDEHVYCMNNGHGQHSWRQQPAAHFTVNCGGEDQPECECWPKNKEHVCWAYQRDDASGPTLENVHAPRHVRILSMKDDGSVVKISFQGEEKTGTLKVGNYNAFMQDAEGCRAITPVKYRVYVRCLGCSTEETEFHTKDGAQFNSVMTIGKMTQKTRSEYTYEAWFKSPLEGKLRREIFGGASSGLTLVNENAVPCMHDVGSGIVRGGKKESGYQLHAGSTDKWSSVCFDKDTFYHVAVTKDHDGVVKVFVNGRDVSAEGHMLDTSDESTLATTFGGGFGDGGQLFNVRIWNHARTQNELYQDAFVTRVNAMSHVGGLDHWWPLTDDLKDVMTGVPLTGSEVRYAPIWCADLELSGMRGC